MKTLNTFLEKEETRAHKKAKELGLKYRGFGYWQDPHTGKTAYKTENGELVPVSKEKQKELENDDTMSLGRADSNREEDPNNPAINAGANVGPAPEPGKERPEPEELDWKPGPDGNNMVNDKERDENDEFPPDVYVGRNNNINWIAGPDGSNYKNMSFDKMMETIMLEGILTEINDNERTSHWVNRGFHKLVAPMLARNVRRAAQGNTQASGIDTHDAQSMAKDFRNVHKRIRQNMAPDAPDSPEPDKNLQNPDDVDNANNVANKSYKGAETRLQTDTMRNANAVRANRGASPLSIPRGVVPPNNLIPDHDD